MSLPPSLAWAVPYVFKPRLRRRYGVWWVVIRDDFLVCGPTIAAAWQAYLDSPIRTMARV